jgi:hypothetical protein
MAAANNFLAELVDADVLAQREKPLIRARTSALQVADHVIELAEPTEDGILSSFIDRYGPRLRSIEFQVDDLHRAVEYLEGKGLGMIDGDEVGVAAIDPADNYGVLYQFTEDNPFDR